MLAVLSLVIAAALLDASSLPATSSPAHAAHRTPLLVLSGTWTLLAVTTLVRGQLRRHEPTAVLVMATALVILVQEGLHGPYLVCSAGVVVVLVAAPAVVAAPPVPQARRSVEADAPLRAPHPTSS